MPLATNKLIIIIDDDDDDCYFAQLGIQKVCPDYKVVAITDSIKAIEHLRAIHQTPDLILLDLYMPLTGLELLAQIKEIPRYELVPISVLSGSADPDQVAAIKQMGVISVLKKPSSLDTIAVMVSKILG